VSKKPCTCVKNNCLHNILNIFFGSFIVFITFIKTVYRDTYYIMNEIPWYVSYREVVYRCISSIPQTLKINYEIKTLVMTYNAINCLAYLMVFLWQQEYQIMKCIVMKVKDSWTGCKTINDQP
jgi:hypothetical protein